MVSRNIGLADGGVPVVRPRGFPLVLAVVASISDVGLDIPDHRLDRKHHSNLCHVALERSSRRVGIASWLGNVGGIRMRSDRCCNNGSAPDESIDRSAILNGAVTQSKRLLPYQGVEQYLRPIHSFFSRWLNGSCHNIRKEDL